MPPFAQFTQKGLKAGIARETSVRNRFETFAKLDSRMSPGLGRLTPGAQWRFYAATWSFAGRLAATINNSLKGRLPSGAAFFIAL